MDVGILGKGSNISGEGIKAATEQIDADWLTRACRKQAALLLRKARAGRTRRELHIPFVRGEKGQHVAQTLLNLTSAPIGEAPHWYLNPEPSPPVLWACMFANSQAIGNMDCSGDVNKIC
jgi:hypothetical protein